MTEEEKEEEKEEEEEKIECAPEVRTLARLERQTHNVETEVSSYAHRTDDR